MMKPSTERGVATIIVLILLAALVTVTTAFFTVLAYGRRSLSIGADQERGLAVAEAGLEKAVWELSRPTSRYVGETDTAFEEGAFTVAVTRLEGAAEAWDVVVTGFLNEEYMAQAQTPGVVAPAPPSRPSAVPELRARVTIDRFDDGRPRRVRVTRWETGLQPPPRSVATAPASRPSEE